MYSRVGTRNYMAPEVLEKRPYRGTSVDIFAAGVILFTMVTGTMPFKEQASVTDELYQYIVRKNYDQFWEAWSTSEEGRKCHKIKSLSSELKDLIVKLLQYCYTERLTIGMIKEHSWYKGKLPTID
jgi:serine/threonine protein kinase